MHVESFVLCKGVLIVQALLGNHLMGFPVEVCYKFINGFYNAFNFIFLTKMLWSENLLTKCKVKIFSTYTRHYTGLKLPTQRVEFGWNKV